MSFSFDVKKELIAVESEPCCKFAQSYGFLLFGRRFSASGMGLMSDYKEIVEAYADAVAYVAEIRPTVKQTPAGKYYVDIRSKKTCKKILTAFGYDGTEVRIRINRANLREDCCLQAFLRGAFLACGSVTAPEKDYHLEFSVSGKTLTDDFVKLFDVYDDLEPEQEISMRPKVVLRNGAYSIYFKSSSAVEDLLGLIGATNATLHVIQTKIYKDVKNNVNRKVNFETANIDRSAKASLKQIEGIRLLEKQGLLAGFPEDIIALAKLRCEEPEMSLSELGEAMNPPMSRSAVNYRMKKLLTAARNSKN